MSAAPMNYMLATFRQLKDSLDSESGLLAGEADKTISELREPKQIKNEELNIFSPLTRVPRFTLKS